MIRHIVYVMVLRLGRYRIFSAIKCQTRVKRKKNEKEENLNFNQPSRLDTLINSGKTDHQISGRCCHDETSVHILVPYKFILNIFHLFFVYCIKVLGFCLC